MPKLNQTKKQKTTTHPKKWCVPHLFPHLFSCLDASNVIPFEADLSKALIKRRDKVGSIDLTSSSSVISRNNRPCGETLAVSDRSIDVFIDCVYSGERSELPALRRVYLGRLKSTSSLAPWAVRNSGQSSYRSSKMIHTVARGAMLRNARRQDWRLAYG